MIEITKIELSKIQKNNKLDNEKLLKEINDRLMNIYKNTTKNELDISALRKTVIDRIEKSYDKMSEEFISEKKKIIDDLKKDFNLEKNSDS